MSNDCFGLILDTSHENSFIVLTKNEFLLDHQIISGGKPLSKYLLPSIQVFLKKRFCKLSYIAVGIGPGSFTGIRVSASIAKTLSYALDIPLISFCSLKAYIPNNKTSFTSLFDAKSGGVYALQGEKTQMGVTFSKPQLLSVEQAKEKLTKTLLISPDATILEKKYENFIIEEKEPDLPFITSVVYDKYQKKVFHPALTLPLLYLKDPRVFSSKN